MLGVARQERFMTGLWTLDGAMTSARPHTETSCSRRMPGPPARRGTASATSGHGESSGAPKGQSLTRVDPERAPPAGCDARMRAWVYARFAAAPQRPSVSSYRRCSNDHRSTRSMPAPLVSPPTPPPSTPPATSPVQSNRLPRRPPEAPHASEYRLKGQHPDAAEAAGAERTVRGRRRACRRRPSRRRAAHPGTRHRRRLDRRTDAFVDVAAALLH